MEASNQPPLANWSALALLNQYRLFVLGALGMVYYFIDDQQMLGGRHAELFETAHLAMVVLTLGYIYLVRARRPSLDTQLYGQHYLDIIGLAVLLYASGGVQSGLAPLILISIALLGHLTKLRHALLFAAIATTIVLAEELLARALHGQDAADFQRTALLGALLFLTGWVVSGPLRYWQLRNLPQRMAPVPLAGPALSTLNAEIIRNLDTGVLVIDRDDMVCLVNDSARALLGIERMHLPEPIRFVSTALQQVLLNARQSPATGNRAFLAENTGAQLLPQFTELSDGGVLIRLDDHGAIHQQFQQLKLASLGKLSASMAHEIRNPLGAIGHSVQLLQESDSLAAADRELLEITHRHTRRINRLVEDVLQLSNRQRVQVDVLDLGEYIETFCARFRTENHLNADRLQCDVLPDCPATFDPEHLDQVLWNLCRNALLHNERPVSLRIFLWQPEAGLLSIDIQDDGQGIEAADAERLFEPFYSTHHEGTGLGLYIIRELCELNHAAIECVPCATGGLFRLHLSRAVARAA